MHHKIKALSKVHIDSPMALRHNSFPEEIQIEGAITLIIISGEHHLLTMNIQTKSIIVLILLGVVDAMIPIPIIGLILIYVFAQKSPWFLDLVQEIYQR